MFLPSQECELYLLGHEQHRDDEVRDLMPHISLLSPEVGESHQLQESCHCSYLGKGEVRK